MWVDMVNWQKPENNWHLYTLHGNYDIINCQTLAIRSLGSDGNYGIEKLCPIITYFSSFASVGFFFSYFDKDWWIIAKPTSGKVAITIVALLEIKHISIYELLSQLTTA